MRNYDSAEYRGKERMMLLTRGRGVAGFAIVLGIATLRVILRMNDDRSSDRPSPASPSPQAITVSDQPSEHSDSLDAILDGIRTQGYRVTVHPLHNAIEMRATSYTDTAKTVSARVDRQGARFEDELRCAEELARQFGQRETK